MYHVLQKAESLIRGGRGGASLTWETTLRILMVSYVNCNTAFRITMPKQVAVLS